VAFGLNKVLGATIVAPVLISIIRNGPRRLSRK